MAAIPETRLIRPRGASALGSLRELIRAATLRPEAEAVEQMRAALLPLTDTLEAARSRAMRWIEAAREHARSGPLAESLLEQFPLDSRQGKALMSLAEALLRTSDPGCADRLIAERLTALRNGGPRSSDLTVRLSMALLVTASRLLPDPFPGILAPASARRPLLSPVMAPLARGTLRRAMRMMGRAFIVGESIESALARGRRDRELSLCSFDVLGEGARSDTDAERYFVAYSRAIDALRAQRADFVYRKSGVSVKLSALEPRYSLVQLPRVIENLVPRMLALARRAAGAGIGLTIDAEEADRLDVSLEVLEALARDADTRGWSGLGLAVQAYGRRAPLVLDWVAELAGQTGRRLSVRLVKGAYWDAEIKRAQERGLDSFPVYTSKTATDANYLVCAQRLLAARDCIYPQFATHNALTVSAVVAMAPPAADYEFQRLHGMGQALYDAVRAEISDLAPVRVYAPVGTHEELLPYLVRRLLENGANTSFVHHFLNRDIPVEQVVGEILPNSANSAEAGEASGHSGPARIREPHALYRSRRNSRGVDFGNPVELAALQSEIGAAAAVSYRGGPILSEAEAIGPNVPVRSPADAGETVGLTRDATAAEIAGAMRTCARAQRAWDATPAEQRAACLERAADLLEQRRGFFLHLLVREAGKTLPDAVAEIREAADFCRYYAERGRELFAAPRELDGPVGEKNLLSHQGRGVFACISPWNFPLAIFTGQITAALMAGNAVVAKPAPATTLIAHAMTRLLHEAGIPGDVLQLAPADGPLFGATALTHPALAGVAFTGSTATAATINRTLAGREGPIVPLIAETGGVNAMIVDATALPEQVVDDVIASAFTSAGQRCSALRVLYLQEEIADRVLEMLIGAMKCLTIGDPADPATDVGPLISADAQRRLDKHAGRMNAEAKLLYACPVEHCGGTGHFFGPRLFELDSPDQLRTEEFGPILHVFRYRADRLPQVLEAIRSTGFGLTLGVHSRLESMAEQAFRALPVGNTYVNRNMIGAVVGVQPFGGQGLSGTGPKAGGPNYLQRFATERTLTINTAAIGGAVEILS
ncbi:MAG: bifunctional proline dehydrogenase/L-glutamate gamma-semialdehyde dehydrogenase PutA [Steroidobacteraceae bacterium]